MNSETVKYTYCTSTVRMPKPKFRVITIREETERKLAELKRELEQKTGKPVSYDDILRALVNKIAEKLEKEAEAQ
jgi:outer membrane protein assembly factor BamA